jgi:peptidoglycan/xylan/chitin deacetylase (PgdA/CDA1 family)
MNLNELSDLAQSRLVEIGSHTVTHSALSALTPDRCRWELAESKRVLEDVVGRPVTAVSYPFGGVEDVGDLPIRLAREAGFDVGCCSVEQTVTAGESAMWLPRLFVPNWNGEEFGRGLRRFFRTPPAGS